MKVAVASGKGGTGPVQLLDCDVEEPNAHLFLHPRLEGDRPVQVPVPRIDPRLCDGCGDCSRACAFNALACMGGPPLVFADLCHGCGACGLVCPANAITETTRSVGVVEWGAARDGVSLVHGRLNPGEAKAPPVIEAVQEHATNDGLTLIDCPPGTACPFVAAALLVTEPTPFGLSDLELAVEAVRLLGIPFAIVVNRAGAGDDRVEAFCRREAIPMLLEIPDDRRIATSYARGEPVVHGVPALRPLFAGLHQALAEGHLCWPRHPEAAHAHL